MNAIGDQIEDIKQKHINLNKFLFVYPEKELHTVAFFGKVKLKPAALIVGICNMIMSAAILINCLENFTFLFFFAYFLPNILLMGGSVLVMLSLEHLDEKKAYWGYILVAFSFLLQIVLGVIAIILSFIYSPKDFFTGLIWNLIIISISLFIGLYFSWVNYCYTKHLGEGHRDLIETGRGDGLVSREQGPGVDNAENSNNQNKLEVRLNAQI